MRDFGMNEREIIKAVKKSDPAKILDCLAKGGNVNARSKHNNLLIEIAALRDQLPIVTLLHEQGADLHACDIAKLITKWREKYPIKPQDTVVIGSYAIDYLIKQRAVLQGYIEIEEDDSDEVLINKLITTLLYENNRHGWNAKSCQEIRMYIEFLNSNFIGCVRWDYSIHITQQETKNNTFYGSYLSDDSDSDEEQAFQKMPPMQKLHKTVAAKNYREHAQSRALYYQKKSGTHGWGDLKTIKHASTTFDLEKRIKIHYGYKVNLNKLNTDLEKLNSLLKKNISIADAQADLQKKDPTFTLFFVAEYRGITYLTTKWNKPSRAAHRKDQEEITREQYSASVLAASQLDFFRSYTAAKTKLKEHAETIHQQAELLREILLTLREPKTYSYNGYTYSCLAYLLQNIYTQDYDGFHQLIKTHSVLKHLLLNEANPFFSMGDTPYHAEKYAYGIKPYKGHESFRLRPRWRDGKAERPYSGMVYGSIHPLTDFTQEGPLHLISLNRAAEIKLDDELNIIAERESCFPSYLSKRVFCRHQAKYPSFKGAYKEIYFYKYGIDEDLYNKLKIKLQNAKPHTDEMKEFKKLLGEWLCSFHEVKLIDKARVEAERRGGVLIYRDINGGFCLTPPIDSVNRNTAVMKENAAILKTPVKQKQAQRAALSPPKNKEIELITDEESIEKVFSDFAKLNLDGIQANIFTEGNHELSLPFSLLLNAVRERRHLALRHYLKIDLFRQEINNTFNTASVKKANLLDLALLNKDFTASKILLEESNININIESLLLKIPFPYRIYFQICQEKDGYISAALYDFLKILATKKIKLFTQTEIESIKTFGDTTSNYHDDFGKKIFSQLDSENLKKASIACKAWFWHISIFNKSVQQEEKIDKIEKNLRKLKL
jgi:hypothetical protein